MKTKCMFKIKNKSKKMNQKGGTDYVDTDFLRCYDTNLIKVMDAMNEYSGKHSIDLELANEFINNQTSPVRREAAKNLIDNTIYITLQEVYDIVGELIDIFYREFNSNDNNSNNTIYLYSGKPEKSGYFLCIIALNHIKQKGYKEPVFVKHLNDEFFDFINESPLIILDDVSYSGSQLSEQLKSIYYSRIYIKNADNPPNIYVLLIALNEFSKHELSKVPSSKRITARGNIYIDPLKDTPFKLIYLEDRLYKPLISVLGFEKFFYLKLMFAPWLCFDDDTGHLPVVSLYLDSKIADPVSTFTTTLTYGQIPPSNIDLSFFINQISDEDVASKVNLNNFPEKEMLVNELSSEFKNEKRILIENLINNFINLDVADKHSDVILFRPFINMCNMNPALIDIIQDKSIQKLDYMIFMIPQECFTKSNCSMEQFVIQNYIEHLKQNGYFVSKEYEVKDKSGKISKKPKITTSDGNLPTMEIHKKITSIKCPVSWYKNGPFKMSCINFVGGKNKSRRHCKYKKTRKLKR